MDIITESSIGYDPNEIYYCLRYEYQDGPRNSIRSDLRGGEFVCTKLSINTFIFLELNKNDGPKFIEYLKKHKEEINHLNGNGSTILHIIVTKSYIVSREDLFQIVKIIIELGINLDVKDDNGYTALMVAIQYSNIAKETAELLISKGANLNIKDNDGRTALMFAIRMFSEIRSQIASEIASLLIYAGADVNIKDNRGYTALMNEMTDIKVIADVTPSIKFRSMSDVDYSGYTEAAELLLRSCFDLNILIEINGTLAWSIYQQYKDKTIFS